MLALSGCSTTNGDVSASLAPTENDIQLDLPETVAILPASQFASAESKVAYPNQEISASAYAAPAAGSGNGSLDQLISKYAQVYEVPVDLVRRVVKRESNFRPEAYNRGHWGLMQIKHQTAKGMGYVGSASGLLDAETNLKYAVKYLRGAYLVADGNHDRADRLYQTGYYYDAKRKGMLEITGLGKDRRRARKVETVAPTPTPAPSLEQTASTPSNS